MILFFFCYYHLVTQVEVLTYSTITNTYYKLDQKRNFKIKSTYFLPHFCTTANKKDFDVQTKDKQPIICIFL